MIIDQCPHCGVRNGLATQKFHEPQPKTDTSWKIFSCQNPACQRLILVEVDRKTAAITLRIYPQGTYELAASLPVSQEVRSEYREAGHCLAVGCHLASMTMSRRVLQRCLKVQKFEQRNLVEQIDAAKADGTIPRRYHVLADEIRHYGNIGAHPDDDKAELVNEPNAKQLLKFVELLIHEFYELPAQAAALTQQRKPS